MIDYVSLIADAFLVFFVGNHFAKSAEREGNPKYYFADNGLLNLFLLRSDGALLENVVATHLHRLRQGELCFLKSSATGVDVDFFLPDDRVAVQVAYALNADSYAREVHNLVKLAQSFDGVDRFVIVTHDAERTIEASGVRIDVVPAYKFLLGEDLSA